MSQPCPNNQCCLQSAFGAMVQLHVAAHAPCRHRNDGKSKPAAPAIVAVSVGAPEKALGNMLHFLWRDARTIVFCACGDLRLPHGFENIEAGTVRQHQVGQDRVVFDHQNVHIGSAFALFKLVLFET